MPSNDDWYEVVSGGRELLQGDLLSECPTIQADDNMPYPLPGDEIPAKRGDSDIVILTQSCDLANDKVTMVLCCPHFDVDTARRAEPSLASNLKDIKKERFFRYALLAAYSSSEISLALRIVDLGTAIVLPKAFLQKVAAARDPRLRLRPPYREHLSQAFARFYMRVARPTEPQI